MKDYILSAESIVDLSQDFTDDLGVKIIYSNYELNEKIYLDDFGQSLDLKSFYDDMRNGSCPTTSMINTASYLEYFRNLAKEGKDIIHICLSTGVSSQYGSLLEAFEILREEYPNQKFYPVDSRMASAGVGMLVYKLANFKNSGMDIDTLYKWAEDNKLHVISYTSNSNLEYIARSGRISRMAANIGGMLKIAPLIEIGDDGHMVVTTKVRTEKKLIQTMVNRMKVNAINELDYSDDIFITHADNIELVNDLVDLLKENFKNANDKIKVFNIGPTIGSHIGPGAINLFYWGKERLK